MDHPLVDIQDLRTHFHTDEGVVPAVDGVSFRINRGETLGVVGESGCGKSITALSVMRLLPYAGRIVGGRILFQGEDLVTKTAAEMRGIRGNDISMIFQEPMTSLNPVYTVGDQVAEAIRLHQGLNKKEAIEKAVEALKMVGIPLPDRRVKEYPHQLSGGMRQRVMIAMALSCNPKLLIADEPTTALDVTIQAQILQLMKKLKEDLHTSIMLITHDLGVVAEMAQRVVVMYAGKVVEESDVPTLFRSPMHPYTEGLMRSIPYLAQDNEQLHAIPGTVPSPLHMPPGCRFNPRCSYKQDRCVKEEPPLRQAAEGHWVRCWLKDQPGRQVA
ncbi:peptide ABC transporter ATP-binding protein [Clostridiales bacterium PH28_bin88]|nr:peptide ABC transporter ATP-binding protein [Clostridiales bacterium PH28_bin88]